VEVFCVFDVASEGVAPALAVPLGLIENAFRRLTVLVKGMDQQAFDYRGPGGDVNSAAMLIAHLAVTDLEYLYRIIGTQAPRELQELVGPYQDDQGRLPVVAERSATEMLAHYEKIIDLTRDHVKTLADEDASRTVVVPWWPQPATVRYVLWHMASHSMFHQGQIARLKAAYAESSAT
jgi:uncharacterized damage-inducible protein DinB